MSEEVIYRLKPGVCSINPCDLIVYTNEAGLQNFYVVSSVTVSTEKQEAVVKAESISGFPDPLCCPISLLELAVSTGCCQVYEGQEVV